MKSRTKFHENTFLLEAWWPRLFALGSAGLLFFLAFFPDEKLARLKLQGFELGIFSLLVLVGLWLLLKRDFDVLSGEPASPEDSRLFRRFDFGMNVCLAIFVLVNAVLWLMSPEKSLATPEMRRVFLGFSAFLVFRLGPMTKDGLVKFLSWWAVLGGVVSIYGLLQYTGGLGRLAVPQMNRVFGTFGNPIFFAAFLVVTILMTIAALTQVRLPSVRLLFMLILAGEILALVLTKTRAAWIAFGATTVLFFLLWKGWRRIPLWIWAAVILFGVGFVWQNRRTVERDQGHLLIWRDTLRMWADHPVSGVGLGAFHVRFRDYAQSDLMAKWPQGNFIVNYAHNEYVQMLAEGGIFPILFFVGFVGFFLWGFIVVRRNPAARGDPVLSALFCASLALLIQNVFSVDMRFGITFGLFFMLTGLAVRRMAGFSLSDRTALPARMPSGIRWGLAAAWIVFMGAVVYPAVSKPYVAHRAFSQQKGFFDERLLDPAKTIEDLEALSEEHPDEYVILERLAFAYAKEMRSPDGKINRERTNDAVATYRRMIRLDPDKPGAYNNLGNVLYTAGRVDDAIKLWETALRLNPEFTDIHLNLGKIYYTKGVLKVAARHFQAVLDQDPDNADAIVYLKKMVE